MARVLVVEPMEELSSLLAHVVLRAGHEPIEYVGAVPDAPQHVDLLLLEPQVPGGLALARQLRGIRSSLPIVCVSLSAPTPEVLALEPVAFLEKPFGLRQLEEALGCALGAPAPH